MVTHLMLFLTLQFTINGGEYMAKRYHMKNCTFWNGVDFHLLQEILRCRSILLLLPAIIFLDIFLILYLLPKGLAKAKVLATLDFIRNIKLVKNERREIQARRIKTDKDIARYMTTKIEHPYFEKIPKKIDQIFILISRVILKML